MLTIQCNHTNPMSRRLISYHVTPFAMLQEPNRVPTTKQQRPQAPPS